MVGSLSLVLLVIPVATLNYDGRFGVPAHGPLAAAAAIGALGVARRLAPLGARVAERVALPRRGLRRPAS
jgi:hypothetical protein